MSTPNPYAPPRAEVSDEPFLGPSELAGPGRRLGAFVLDCVFVAFIFLPSMVAVGMERLRRGGELAPAIGGLLSMVILLAWLAWSLVLLHHSGQTLGKRILNIRIVRRSGARASLPRLILLRFLVAAVMMALPYIGRILFVADSALLLGRSRQCLHDRTADTIVVKL